MLRDGVVAGGAGPDGAPAIDLARPGPSEAAWADDVRRRHLPRWEPPGAGHLVLVSPHPDDETLPAGGLISLLERAGWTITVIALTDGEAAYPDVPGLAEVRVEEQRRAVAALAPGGSATIERLGLPDGGLSGVGDLDDRLVPWFAGATLVLAPWPGDGHPDHEAAGHAARRAAAARGVDVAFLPIWAWHWQEPDRADFLDAAVVVELDADAVAAKAAAVDVYRSQWSPVGVDPILPEHVLARFRRPFEVLAR